MKREPFNLINALLRGQPVCTASGIGVKLVRLELYRDDYPFVEGHLEEAGHGFNDFTRRWTLDGKEIQIHRVVIKESSKSRDMDLRMGHATTFRCSECGRWTPSWIFARSFAKEVTTNGAANPTCPVCAMLATEALRGQQMEWEIGPAE